MKPLPRRAPPAAPCPPLRVAPLAALLAVLLTTLAACGGYAELPLPLRELAALDVESASLHPGAPGRVQVVLTLPEGALGPTVVVGHPAADLAQGARVVAWAAGPCPAGPTPAASDERLRLCLAIELVTTAPPEALDLTAVVETRGDGRRFTAFGALDVASATTPYATSPRAGGTP